MRPWGKSKAVEATTVVYQPKKMNLSVGIGTMSTENVKLNQQPQSNQDGKANTKSVFQKAKVEFT